MTVYYRGNRGNWVRLYDGHRGNSGDGDSIHGNTAVAETKHADDRAVIFVSRDSRDTNRSSFIGNYGDTCRNIFRHHCNIGVKPTHPFLIVCSEVFHCEIHGIVPLLEINMLPLHRLRK